ncbi:MAG: N-acetylmuramoyl-L-alanine amidase [Planctomycetes bacterium]|nr:N-acetylmuramoyl-L-alanine amidase [Planctomycetota bacterium]
MTRMGGYDRITVHHEGNATPNYDSSVTAVAACLRRIQSEHCKRMGAGDIGYHFIIDRQGMIWQGRELCYQGAHVKSNNSNNIGIMCLGNFEIQQPTQAQVNTLASLCRALMAGYHIPANRLYGHRELRSTACPGRNLFPQLVNIRKQVVTLV